MEAFLTHLAVERKVSASTQNQARSALLFLYKEVLGIELARLDDVVAAKRGQRLPVVLTQHEARALLAELDVCSLKRVYEAWHAACSAVGQFHRLRARPFRRCRGAMPGILCAPAFDFENRVLWLAMASLFMALASTI